MDFFNFQIEPDEEYGSPSHRIYLRQMRAAIRQAVAEAFALKVRESSPVVSSSLENVPRQESLEPQSLLRR